MRRLLPAALGLVLAVALSGCGGDDGGVDETDRTAAPPSRSTSAPSSHGGLTVTDGSTPDELVTCLTGAGLTAAPTDSTMMGVDDPHVEVHVDAFEGFEGPGSQQADLYVFADPAAAQKNAPYLTLGGSDDPGDTRFAVRGNVVLTFYIVTDSPPTADESAVLGCLPS